MKKQLFLLIALLAFTAVAAPNKPNVIVILGDDMGIDSVSAFNPKLGLKTPAFARQSARLKIQRFCQDPPSTVGRRVVSSPPTHRCAPSPSCPPTAGMPCRPPCGEASASICAAGQSPAANAPWVQRLEHLPLPPLLPQQHLHQSR